MNKEFYYELIGMLLIGLTLACLYIEIVEVTNGLQR
jgi:hypothetical protein